MRAPSGDTAGSRTVGSAGGNRVRTTGDRKTWLLTKVDGGSHQRPGRRSGASRDAEGRVARSVVRRARGAMLRHLQHPLSARRRSGRKVRGRSTAARRSSRRMSTHASTGAPVDPAGIFAWHKGLSHASRTGPVPGRIAPSNGETRFDTCDHRPTRRASSDAAVSNSDADA